MDTLFRGNACPVLQLRAPRLSLALERGRLDVQDHLIALCPSAAHIRTLPRVESNRQRTLGQEPHRVCTPLFRLDLLPMRLP